MTSARPRDNASSVEKRSKTRTGSSELSTVTALASRSRSVREAMPARTLKGHPGMRAVRSMNHLAYEDLGAYAEPAGGPFRTAIAVASDDVAARKAVALLVDELGFDPVELDGRSAWLLDANGPFFGRRLSQAEMNAIVSASRRADRLTW